MRTVAALGRDRARGAPRARSNLLRDDAVPLLILNEPEWIRAAAAVFLWLRDLTVVSGANNLETVKYFIISEAFKDEVRS